jgi:hypothetical protein
MPRTSSSLSTSSAPRGPCPWESTAAATRYSVFIGAALPRGVRVTEVDRQTCRARLVPPSDSPVGRHHPGSRGLITSARVVDRNYWARIGNSLRNSALDRRVDRRLRVGRQCGPRLSRRCGCDVREDLRCPGTCRPRFRLSPGQSLRFLAALPVRSMQAPGGGESLGSCSSAS